MDSKTKWAIGIVAGVIIVIISLISFIGWKGLGTLSLNDSKIQKMVEDTAQSQRLDFNAQAVSLQDSLESIKFFLTDTSVTFSKGDFVKFKKTIDDHMKSDKVIMAGWETRLTKAEKQLKVFQKYIQNGFSEKYTKDTTTASTKKTVSATTTSTTSAETSTVATTTSPVLTTTASTAKDTSTGVNKLNEKKGIFHFGNKTAKPKIKKKPVAAEK
jgi:hypothetical protein